MDLVLCIFFGLLAAGITTSLFENNAGLGIKFIVIAGVSSGALASLTGLAGGWSDLALFNIYNVFISILLATAATALYQRAVAKRNKGFNVMAQATTD